MTQIAGSSGGLLYMIAATSFIAAVMFLEAIPVYLVLNSQFRGIPLATNALVVCGGALTAVVVLVALAIWLPMRWGRKKLTAMEI